jgi:hypothetical protein
VYQLRIADDLVYLVLGAVAAHVPFPKYVGQAGATVDAVDDVMEDLLLPPRARRAAEE